MAQGDAREAMADEARGFEEKPFFEYHLYTLGRPSSLPDNSTKQIELFPQVAGVPCEKTLVYYGQAGMWDGYGGSPYTDRNYGLTGNKKVDTYLSFKNTQENGMGMPHARRARAREQARHRGRLARVHRRGPHRSHAEERDHPAQARLGLRRRRRAQAGRLQHRHRAAR